MAHDGEGLECMPYFELYLFVPAPSLYAALAW
uniref:Uncharacterized protein n=1 Tax=Anguilla anguilla TaxID=7936 RepID=A0A0E9SYR4_ANGAN